MGDISQLTREADSRRQAFFAEAAQFRQSLAPRQLIDEAVVALDPDFSALRRTQSLLRDNPFASLVAAAGAWLLLRQYMRPHALKPVDDVAVIRRKTSTPSILKGDQNGQFHEFKHKRTVRQNRRFQKVSQGTQTGGLP